MMSNEKQTLSKVREVRYRYIPVEEMLKNEETDYVSYGISVRAADDEVDFISDVSTDFEEVTHLAEQCTAQQLAPEHLRDVIEDFLNSENLSLT